MPGLLTHLTIAFVGFLIILMFTRDWKYGLVWVIGTLIPDTIKFGIPGIMSKTADFYKILSKPIYWTLNYYTHSVVFWIIFFLIVLIITFLLYKFKKIDKIKLKTYIIANLIFLLAIIIHLVMDYFIIEKSYWI